MSKATKAFIAVILTYLLIYVIADLAEFIAWEVIHS